MANFANLGAFAQANHEPGHRRAEHLRAAGHHQGHKPRGSPSGAPVIRRALVVTSIGFTRHLPLKGANGTTLGGPGAFNGLAGSIFGQC